MKIVKKMLGVSVGYERIMKDIKIIIATHKKYSLPVDEMYLPVHVGKKGGAGIGYTGDDSGNNISIKNPYFCELTGLYWAWKNLEYEYLGMVHYRRYFSERNLIVSRYRNKEESIAGKEYIEAVLEKYDIVVPKRRRYYIESLYSHYAHTHYAEHLDITRKVINSKFPEYLLDYDKVMQRKSGHMFNMFIMEKKLVDKYCSWLFPILFELEAEIDMSIYSAYQARLFGRVSELLFNVWLNHEKVTYKEIPVIHMERINWWNKGKSFLKSKFFNEKSAESF